MHNIMLLHKEERNEYLYSKPLYKVEGKTIEVVHFNELI